MHFDSRPAWRYQWPTFVTIFAMFAALLLAAVYGPAHIGPGVSHILIAIAGALVLYCSLLVVYRRFAWRYLIDDHNIESYHGVIARRVHSIRIDDLRNINLNQTPMQRLFGVGDVEFSSAGGEGIEVVFFGVTDPLRIKQLAQRLQSGTRVPRPEPEYA